MNREERRNTVKKLQKKGLKRETAETIVERMDFAEHHFSRDVWEGEKVKLNYDRITHYKDWKILRQEYRDFVTTNKDTVFTVEFDEDDETAAGFSSCEVKRSPCTLSCGLEG